MVYMSFITQLPVNNPGHDAETNCNITFVLLRQQRDLLCGHQINVTTGNTAQILFDKIKCITLMAYLKKLF